jgi:FAD/FMN-containing dehydrogenase
VVAVSSWGRLGNDEHELHCLTDRRLVKEALLNPSTGIAYGMGRSYGDVCLNPNGVIWNTRGLDKFISFDETTGRLCCEAGVLLRDIQQILVPRGWMLPVTPGTQLVTVGGAIANDVHGKNHHALGSFGDHVTHLSLQRTDGTAIECSPTSRASWFAATVGGLGLTGVILSAELQLRKVASPWLATETIPYRNLDEFFDLADQSEANWEHTVSWIDCLAKGGRGIFMRGNHTGSQNLALPIAKPKRMPVTPPISLVNPLTLKPFNTAYFNLKNWSKGNAIVHYESFFYPLDNLLEWNKMYGPKGFYQYQSVVPRSARKEAIQAMLQAISQSGEGSFLAVLKTFGERESLGMLSFPQPGVTLALDFANKGPKTLKLFDRLDAIVSEAGGRIYPAKDARMPKELFESGYPRLTEFLSYRDPGISSAMSRRLIGT